MNHDVYLAFIKFYTNSRQSSFYNNKITKLKRETKLNTINHRKINFWASNWTFFAYFPRGISSWSVRGSITLPSLITQ